MNSSETDQNEQGLVRLVSQAVEKQKKADFKGFLLFIKDDANHLKALDQKQKADNIGLCLLKGPEDEAVRSYSINTDAKVRNTVLLYKNRKVARVFINLDPEKDAARFNGAVQQLVAP